MTPEMLATPNKALSVICDVSCDPYSDYNPIPIYQECTRFDQPILALGEGSASVDLIAIDHLPSLLPRESSEDYCQQLFDTLVALENIDAGVWKRAKDVFIKHSQAL